MVPTPGSPAPDHDYGPEPDLAVADDYLQITPGGMVQTEITLTHTGTRVESFTIDVVGLPPEWCTALPPTLELLPGTSKESVVTFRPPAGTPSPDATLPFGIRAASTLDPGRSVVEEGDLEIARQPALQTELVPVTSRARWRGKHVVRLTNGGNVPLHLELTSQDANQDLAFLISPTPVVVPVNGSVAVRLKARIRKPRLRAKAERLPFEVTVRPRDGASPGGTASPWALPQPGSDLSAPGPAPAPPDTTTATLHGAVERRSVISPGTVAALLLVVALLAGLGAFVLRAPTVVGARHEDSAPATPTGLQVLSFDGPTANLRWARNDNARHRIEMQVKDSTGTGTDTAARDAPTAPPYANTFTYTVKQPQPGATYCFDVIAVRGTFSSDRSAPVCRAMARSALRAPTITEIKPLEDGTGLVTWEGGSPGDVTLFSSDLEGVPDGRVQRSRVKGQAPVALVTGNNCFVTRVSAGGRTSPFGQPTCVGVPAPTSPLAAGDTAATGPGGTSASSSPSGSVAGNPSSSTSPPTTTVPGLLHGWAPLTAVQTLTPGRDSAQAGAEVQRAANLFKANGFPEATWRQLTPTTYNIAYPVYVVLLAPPTDSEVAAQAVCDRAMAASATVPELSTYRAGGCTPRELAPKP